MINVKKNMLVAAALETVLLIIAVPMLMLISLGPDNHSLWELMTLSWAELIIALLMQRNISKKGFRHRIKILDFKENSEPVDMWHNDEREWRLMLTAQYVSARVTLVFTIVAMTVVPISLGIILAINSSFKPTAMLMLLSFLVILASILLVSEWSYVLAYFKLNRD